MRKETNTPDLRIMWFVPPAVSAWGQESGIEVEGVPAVSSDAQFEALSAGECDAVVTAMDNVFAWNRRPGPGDFRIIAQMESTTPLSLIGRRPQALAELAGAEFLVDAPGNGFVVALRAMLAAAGVAPQNYALQEAGGVKARFDALLAGRGDATLLGPPFDALALQAGLALIARVQDAYPLFPGQGLVARAALPPARRAALAAWLGTLDAACRHAHAAPEAAARDLARLAKADAPTVAALLGQMPTSLQVDRAGIELLIEHRRRLDMPGGADSYEQLVSHALPAPIKEENQ